MERRFTSNFDLRVYRGRIYDNGTSTDNRTQVRVLPYMADYEDDECTDLPKFPALFKGQVHNGFCEKKDGADKAEEVVILATEDFTYGFVIGKASMFYGVSDTVYLDSYNYSFIESYLSQRGFDTNNINYEDFIVQTMCMTPQDDHSGGGGLVELYNFRTGDKFIIHASGACIGITGQQVYIRCGSPTMDGSTPKYSSITITPTKITCNTDVFEVNAKNVILGKHGMNVLGTSSVAPVACSGSNLQPITNVTV